jgi:hypothetical protein
MPRRAYYEKAKGFLINPIQKVITVMREERTCNMWCAGETALSQETQLNPPRIEEMAIYKGDETIDQFETVDERLVDQEDVVRVQLWKYNPSYFANSGRVDRISLACSFIGNEDERIEMSIDELLEDL